MKSKTDTASYSGTEGAVARSQQLHHSYQLVTAGLSDPLKVVFILLSDHVRNWQCTRMLRACVCVCVCKQRNRWLV